MTFQVASVSTSVGLNDIVPGVAYGAYTAWGAANTGIVAYSIVDGSQSEVGWGFYDGVTIARYNVVYSTSNGNFINLSGNNEVVILLNSSFAQGPYMMFQPQVIATITYNTSETVTILGPNAQIYMAGASGGSGAAAASASSGGTGSGGYYQKYLVNLVPNNTLTFTAGTGGAGGTGTNGGANGTASVLASGTQTISTLTAGGSNGTAYSPSGTGTASAAGVATGGDFNFGVAGNGIVAGTMNTTTYPGSVSGVNGASSTNGNNGNNGLMTIIWYT